MTELEKKMALLNKNIANLDKDTAGKLIMKVFFKFIINPKLFTENNRDAEQVAWFEKEIAKLNR